MYLLKIPSECDGTPVADIEMDFADYSILLSKTAEPNCPDKYH